MKLEVNKYGMYDEMSNKDRRDVDKFRLDFMKELIRIGVVNEYTRFADEYGPETYGLKLTAVGPDGFSLKEGIAPKKGNTLCEK